MMLPAFVGGSVLTLMELWLAGQLDLDNQNNTQSHSTTIPTMRVYISLTENGLRYRIDYARLLREHARVGQIVSHSIMGGAQIDRSSMTATSLRSHG